MLRLVKILVLTVLVVNALALSIFIFGTTVFGQLPQVITKSPLMFQDLVKYYACGRIAVSDRRDDPYSITVQHAQIAEVLAPYNLPELPKQYSYPIDYPPLIFGVMAPFGLLAFPTVLTLWVVLSVGSVIAGIYFLSGCNRRRTSLAVLGLAACALSWRTLAMGQMTWLILGVSALFFYGFRDRKDVVGGMALALTALKLQYAIFYVIPLLMARRWKMLAVTATCWVVIGTAAFLLVPAAFYDYVQTMSRIEQDDPYVRSMVCFRGLASWALDGPSLNIASAVAAVVGVVLCFVVWRKMMVSPPERLPYAIALTHLIALLFSPHSHSYDLLLLTVPIVAALAARPTWMEVALAFIPLSWLTVAIPDSQLIWQVAAYFMYLTVLAVLAWRGFTGISSTGDAADGEHDKT